MRKVSMLVIALCLCSSLVWGSGDQDEGTAGDDLTKYYEISFGWFGERDFTDDPVYDIVKEKFNVDIKIAPLTWGEHNAQINLMVASGEMPDAVFASVPRAQYVEWAESGAIREIPTFPDSRYPNLSAMWDRMPQAGDRYLVNGKLYSWPKYLAQNPVGNWWPTGFLFRKDWAKELGMYKTQYTIDEMMDLARAFVDKDPGGNGPGRTVGYGDNDQWSYIIYGHNTYASHFYKKNGKFVWGAREQSTIDGIKAVKRLYDDGAYYQDFFTAKAGDLNALFNSGLAGIIQGNFNSKNLGKMRVAFEDANPDTKFMDAVEYMDVVGPDGKRWSWEMTNIWSTSIFNPTLEEAKLDRMLTIMDWLCTDEAVNTLFFGVPGKDWEMVDGKPSHRWPVDDKCVPKRPPYQSKMLLTMAQLEETYTWIDPAMQGELIDSFVAHLERLGQNSNFRETDPMLITFEGENWLKHGHALAWTEYSDTIKRILPSTTIGTIEAEYKKWLDEVKPRVDAVLAELNEAL